MMQINSLLLIFKPFLKFIMSRKEKFTSTKFKGKYPRHVLKLLRYKLRCRICYEVEFARKIVSCEQKISGTFIQMTWLKFLATSKIINLVYLRMRRKLFKSSDKKTYLAQYSEINGISNFKSQYFNQSLNNEQFNFSER